MNIHFHFKLLSSMFITLLCILFVALAFVAKSNKFVSDKGKKNICMFRAADTVISSCRVYEISRQEIEQLGISFPRTPFLSLCKQKGIMLFVAMGNTWSLVLIDSPVYMYTCRMVVCSLSI